MALLCVFTILLLFIMDIEHSTYATFPRINKDEVEVKYPEGIRSERKLPLCETTSPCSVIHLRFWEPLLVERICRCSGLAQCARKWSEELDNTTMFLNNRSQFKFCQGAVTLDQCSANLAAFQVVNTTRELTITSPTLNRTTTIDFSERITYKVNCNCSSDHYYWKHTGKPRTETYENGTTIITETYKCAKLRKCTTMEFCGNIRADLYSSYYRCSCPIGHWCVFEDRMTYDVKELFYSGLAYKGVCYPHSQ